MKKSLSTLILLFIGASSFAQQDIFALTGKDASNINFQDFRALDSKKGITETVLLSGQDQPRIYSHKLNKEIFEDKKSSANALADQIATLAVDGRGKLVYMPMFSSNIYILDSKTKDITLLENKLSNPTTCDVGSQFSRMTAGNDGSIYTLSNSGSQLLKISYKDGEYAVTDLGIVKDDSGNGDNLLSKMLTGFGGDMIADENNNFYIFSALGNVFKIVTKDMKAHFVGKVKGLAENFSINGAAVNAEGKIILASAKGGVLHTLNLETLQAEPMNVNIDMPIYDLGSSYVLRTSKNVININKNDIYPTKVSDGFVNVSIGESQKGNAQVKIYSLNGTLIMDKKINNISNSENKIELGKLVSGVYIVNVESENGKTIISKKIIVK
ncbi:T9SS type A sorting domain-containing protein [Epilithonimonas hungarica]|uniref:Por secretion system C-terminal sorting domain-containing protein n=1 Tax=Epilithonimonas hungarica TaxID=454006 RepID=A0A1G7HDM2_9FLAO|nr:T9SS type A sorting domain-containing protein [Epilithonimonas hungarica]SDE98404.1 Por secretion system C-terminal sorting domain-containing protein [Epilithonimonas hungarica]